MKIPLHVILQECDDEIRNLQVSECNTDGRFLLIKAYKSFYALEDEKKLCNTADFILLNWFYPAQLFFDFIQIMGKKAPGVKMIVTFDFVQPDFIAGVLKQGAYGFFIKPFSIHNILLMPDFFNGNEKLKFHVLKLAD